MKKAQKLHPWRSCQIGHHWVKKHNRKHGEKKLNVRGYCRANFSKKDQLYKDEMLAMTSRYFRNLGKLPSIKFKKFIHGDDFDSLIIGWTRYWNDVLKPAVPLDPIFVKVLIATESSFNIKARALATRNNYARGLMQVTDQSRIILQDERGELSNFLINLTLKDVENPTLNIAAGVRWLFQKQKLASKRLKRDATWMETVIDYKGYTKDIKKGNKEVKNKMLALQNLYTELVALETEE